MQYFVNVKVPVTLVLTAIQHKDDPTWEWPQYSRSQYFAQRVDAEAYAYMVGLAGYNCDIEQVSKTQPTLDQAVAYFREPARQALLDEFYGRKQ